MELHDAKMSVCYVYLVVFNVAKRHNCCFEKSKETSACVSRNECPRRGLRWGWGYAVLGGEPRGLWDLRGNARLSSPHTKCLLVGLCKSKLNDDVPFATVLISALSVTPVLRQVCAYAKLGGRRVLGDSRDPGGERCLGSSAGRPAPSAGGG